MSIRRLFGLWAVASLVAGTAGCRPHLMEMHKTHYFGSSMRCSQGPVEAAVSATGASWGESFSFALFVPRRVVGHYRIMVDGKVVGSGLLRPVARRRSNKQWDDRQRRYVVQIKAFPINGAKADNGRCVRPRHSGLLPTSGAGRATGEAVGDWAKGQDGRTDGTGRSDQVAPKVEPRKVQASARAIPLASLPEGQGVDRVRDLLKTRLGAFVYRAGQYSRGGSTIALDGCPGPPTARFRRGQRVSIQVWFDEPNDLEGALLLVEHVRFIPKPSDRKLRSKLLKRRRACLARRARRKASMDP